MRMRRSLARVLPGACLAALALAAHAEAPTPERVLELCAKVEGPAHCGRMIEAEQLKALPNLATREGDTLNVRLFPSGNRLFVDSIASQNEKSYALWDYWSPANAVVLFVTSGDALSYAVLQRTSNRLTELPAEPILSPDRQRVAVSDVCSRNCANEIGVWRISRDGITRELAYRPPATWSDVTVRWKDPQTLTLQFTPAGASAPRTEERSLKAADWQRF